MGGNSVCSLSDLGFRFFAVDLSTAFVRASAAVSCAASVRDGLGFSVAATVFVFAAFFFDCISRRAVGDTFLTVFTSSPAFLRTRSRPRLFVAEHSYRPILRGR